MPAACSHHGKRGGGGGAGGSEGGGGGGGDGGGSGVGGGEQCEYTSSPLLHLPLSDVYTQNLKVLMSLAIDEIAFSQPAWSFLKY